MKLTNKQIRQIIKEELNKVLNEEEKEKTVYKKIIALMSKDTENLGVALSLYDALKDDPGAFQEVEKEHFQRLIPYASAVHEYKSLLDEMSSIARELGTRALRDPTWKALKSKRASAQMDYREKGHNVNAADKTIIYNATGIV